jgi:hypothetical protein
VTSVSSVFLPFRKRFEIRTSNAADSFSAIDNYARKRRRHERLAFLVPSEKQVKKIHLAFVVPKYSVSWSFCGLKLNCFAMRRLTKNRDNCLRHCMNAV